MKYKLCGRSGGCCPTVEIKEIVIIKNDAGATIELTLEEFGRLQAITIYENGVQRL